MPTILTNGIQLPDKGSVDWYSSMQSNYNLIDTHLGDTDVHVTAEDKANWNSKQGSLSQTQLDAIAQVATNTDDIATLQSGKANASHTHSSNDITDIGDYATKQYVDNSISGLVDSAPNALDTLNELAAALNDDANFASTVTTALATKANSADLATVATSGSYTDLTDKPTIPANTSDLTNDSDFVVSSNLATVATSGDYDDLSNKPSIPTNTSDLNNDSDFVTLNDFDIPAKTSDLTNDSGFITSSDVPTSTSDLINDSNFVDTSNSAVASGITSAKVTAYDSHIADTDIHVTAADKTKWNNGVTQAYVVRYASVAVSDNSTVPYANLNNTDNIKANDLLLDTNGKIYQISSVDTANETVSVTTPLTQLALDANVMHLSGDETANGKKTFNNVVPINGVYVGNEPSASFRTVLLLRSRYDTVGKSGWLVSKFRSNSAQGALSGSDTVFLNFDVLENEVRTNGILRFNLSSWSGNTPGRFSLIPNSAIESYLGTSGNKWATINGLEPSALGMPDLANGIDISSYITHLDKVVNQYTPPANGYINIRVRKTSLPIVSIRIQQNYGLMNSSETADFSTWGICLPVIAGQIVEFYISADSLMSAVFFPCQGNV